METWKFIAEYYEKLANEDEWKDFAAMEKLVKTLIANRNLSGIFAHTSHMNLVITKSEEYEKWFEEPALFVELNFGASKEYLYKISFVEPIENNEIIRVKEEANFCSFEKSLEIFDEMCEKLESASN